MKNTRTNALLAQIMILEEKLVIEEKSNITIFFNGNSLKGKIISDDEYYDLQANSKYKDIYEKYIKKPREPYIMNFNESGNLTEFPDYLRQVYLHFLPESGKSIQVRMADIVAFSFD